jgi:two-component system, cell cycle sensor histidine kinase and response regulator CckA
MKDTSVLVVDDEAALRAMFARALADVGYHVLEASDGVEALELLRQAGAQIRLIVTDIRMPRMDGYELAERIGASPHPVPMLFISANAQKGSHLPGPVLEKPFTPAALRAAVARLLSG